MRYRIPPTSATADSPEAAMLAARTLRQDWIAAGGLEPPVALVYRDGNRIPLYTVGDLPAAVFA